MSAKGAGKTIRQEVEQQAQPRRSVPVAVGDRVQRRRMTVPCRHHDLQVACAHVAGNILDRLVRDVIATLPSL
ncbi:hypothetical protein IHE27_13355 [Mycetohabitans endofungorum]